MIPQFDTFTYAVGVLIILALAIPDVPRYAVNRLKLKPAERIKRAYSAANKTLIRQHLDRIHRNTAKFHSVRRHQTGGMI